MPAAGSVRASDSSANCGLRRERGMVPDVRERRDAARLEQPDQLVQRARGVADGEHARLPPPGRRARSGRVAP